VRHATPETLDLLEPLLAELRRISALRERKRGNFCRGSQAFLHFHEDAAGLFADVKVGRGWERLPVDGARAHAALLRRVRRLLADGAAPRV
jgi:hypothetical protein